MSPEETFRRVLAARLPSGPGWTAWIDGTVAELAAAEPWQAMYTAQLAEAFHQRGLREETDAKLAQIRAICADADLGRYRGMDARQLADAIREALGAPVGAS